MQSVKPLKAKSVVLSRRDTVKILWGNAKCKAIGGKTRGSLSKRHGKNPLGKIEKKPLRTKPVRILSEETWCMHAMDKMKHVPFLLPLLTWIPPYLFV